MKERIASYSGSTMAMYLIWQEEQPLDGKSRVSIDHTLGTRTCGDYEDSQSQLASIFRWNDVGQKSRHGVRLVVSPVCSACTSSKLVLHCVLRQQHVRFVVKKITHTRLTLRRELGSGRLVSCTLDTKTTFIIIGPCAASSWAVRNQITQHSR